MIKHKIFILLCTLFVVYIGCNKSSRHEEINPNDLIGSWSLFQVGAKQPESINIKSHIITFSSDGTWKSITEMTGQWAGTKMKGSGKWILDKSIVSYTAGDNSGKSTVTLAAQRLSLNPDFIIALDGGKTPVDTQYSK